jgi:hypothetical protein
MAYEGKVLSTCPDSMFDFGHANVVVVSGDWPNVYDHMLLKAGTTYFQVVLGGFAGIHATPRYMNQAGFDRYLKETGKRFRFQYPIAIPHPERAQLKLEQLLSKPWWWGGAVHNCEGLVEEIVMAGGGPRIHKGLLMLPAQSRPHQPQNHSSAFETRHDFPF